MLTVWMLYNDFYIFLPGKSMTWAAPNTRFEFLTICGKYAIFGANLTCMSHKNKADVEAFKRPRRLATDIFLETFCFENRKIENNNKGNRMSTLDNNSKLRNFVTKLIKIRLRAKIKQHLHRCFHKKDKKNWWCFCYNKYKHSQYFDNMP